jgi:hypothetical protein
MHHLQVVPGALLEMSRSIMRSTFSSLILKPVYTFLFDRSDEATEELYSKLLSARESNAVVVTNPTSVKSFVLKFVEILQLIELNRVKRTGGDGGMRLEQFKEQDTCVEAKLVGIQGKWEDGAALMWATNMKKLGLEPYRDDPDWNNVVDSKGNKLYGTKRTMLGGLWLKFVKPPNWNATQVEVLSSLRQLDPFRKIFELFNEGVLLMDEVDLLLHPLKSELNWPLGAKEALDLTIAPKGSPENDDGSKRWAGLRWQVSFHLIDAVHYCWTRTTSLDYRDNAIAERALRSLYTAFQKGIEDKLIQATPHLVVLDHGYYSSTLKPLFAQWIMVWLSDKGISGVSQAVILDYILKSGAASKETLTDIKKSCSAESLKILNLANTLLTSILPHALGKINRVSFGLLDDEYLDSHQSDPISRRQLAIPFIGKDVPSGKSEFSHPDVVIMLSISAYRYEGLRRQDFKELLRTIVSTVAREVGKIAERPTSLRWQQWIRLAGGKVRGIAHNHGVEEGDTRVLPNKFHPSDVCAEQPCIDEDILNSIWPLHLIDFKDRDQFEVLYKLLRKLPQVLAWYLTHIVFPVTMRFQMHRLSSCGQELGGNLVFKNRLGFSGTPSNLLPVEFGTCCFEKGDDGKILRTLTSPIVVSIDILEGGWTAKSVLDRVASANPPYHALIDTGALVTGYDNLGVAVYLMKHGLQGFDACIFLDSCDRKMALLRVGMTVVRLEQCGVALDRRFTFYDQTHTTGMDIKQFYTAQAAVTLGKDMTFRDLAQGAYRCFHLCLENERANIAFGQIEREFADAYLFQDARHR